MFLKALTLKGFKSFAEKTDLSFEPGVTVVVGPNGSGKSNLVDAIAWVLGAQGARALRGAKMDDVIFAGTTKKPALGRAEVSLTIDNSDSTLPIEFSEVTITRTLFRSGESEYRLNDVPCRLLDIQELLSDSRIGRTQHVIVGQGQLDSVLNARPEDRRAIIEEAAGVLKFRKRREKAQRRLESTEGNLTRLNDLVREVKRQLTPLQRQADAARRHDGVQEELKSIKLFLIGKEIQGLQGTISRIENDSLRYKEEEKTLLSELSDLDSSVLDAETALMKVGDSDVATWLTRAERLVAKANATKDMLGERKRSIQMQLEASADESVIESLIAERTSLESAIKELENSNEVLAPTLESLRNDYREFMSNFDGFLENAPSEDVVFEFDQMQKEKKLHEENHVVLKDRLDSDVARLINTQQRLDLLSQDNSDANEVIERETKVFETLNSDLALVKTNIDGMKSSVDQLEKENQTLRNQSAKSKAQYEVISEAYETMVDSTTIKQLSHLSGVLGLLIENISIDERATDAVSTALDFLKDSIVVKDIDSARMALKELSTKNSSARLIVLNDQVRNSNEVPQNCEPLIKYISSSDEQLMKYLQNILSNTMVTDLDWQQACEISAQNPHLTIVTFNGDKFEGTLNWSIGKTTAKTITKENVEHAQRESENNSRLLEDNTKVLIETKHRLDQEMKQESNLISQINSVNSRKSIASQTARTTASAIESRKKEVETLENEIAQLKEMISSELDLIQELTLKLNNLQEIKDNFDEKKTEFDQKLREHESTKSTLENEIRRIEIENERIQTRLNDSKMRLEKVLSRLAKDPEQEQKVLQRRNELIEAMRRIDDLSIRVSAVEQGSSRVREVLTDERERQKVKAHESTSRLESLRKTRKEKEENLLHIRNSMQKDEINQAETKTKLFATIEALRASFDCEPQVAIDASMPEVTEGMTLTSRARELERDLKLMGPINPLAISEYDELNERHIFLNEQLDDVKASRRELHKVIKNIDVEIVTVFEKAFEDVQKHFSDLFSTLFSGGAGRLTLTDPTDMLNTGIEMEARPSGKNVRRLSLLSGGERSLTALAFLFAVFRSRPSPFYVMDEVEAALDEPNLMRFLDLVAEFRDDAQLLIVSHQKKTMEAADELYGVSMAPGGSSRAIKQRIEQPSSKENFIDLNKLEEEENKEEPILESSI
ncbi:MAG: chromosome segregation protein SMC [Acidimicrobiia bacterium]